MSDKLDARDVNINGSINFEGYKVLKASFDLNTEFESDEPIDITISLGHDYQVENKNMLVQFSVKVFEDAKNKNLPFEVLVTIEGIFSFEDGVEAEKFLPNALAILYPYMRAIVSSYTALANVTSLTLPTININRYLEDIKKENI
ncbi:MAG: hypothetical protein ACLVCA_02770 [Peptoniphilus sp.]|uniref:hypothetical protein n=1 Tax=Peptoniphilus sp. TaxID=1971214 RepID=UPI00399990AD